MDDFYVTEEDDTDEAIKFNDERVVMRTRFMLTPGCMPKVSFLAIPCGRVSEHQTTLFTNSGPKFWGAPSKIIQSSQGSVKIDLTFYYDSSNTTTTTREVKIRPGPSFSKTDSGFGREPYGAGSLFARCDKYNTGVIYPESLDTFTKKRQYCRATVCEITVTEVEAARVNDLVIYEVPTSFTALNTDSGYWVAHNADSAPPRYPVEQQSDTNPRGGTYMLHDVMHDQRALCGPMLLNWQPLIQASSSSDPNYSTTATTWTNVLDPTNSDADDPWDDTTPGFNCNSAGYAADFEWSNELRLHERRVSIPVKVNVFNDGEASTATRGGKVRVYTAQHSFVEIDCTRADATDDGQLWYTAYGHLEVDTNPEGSNICRIYFKADSANTFRMGAVTVERMGNYTPQKI